MFLLSPAVALYTTSELAQLELNVYFLILTKLSTIILLIPGRSILDHFVLFI
jgi:hypothetical protein